MRMVAKWGSVAAAAVLVVTLGGCGGRAGTSPPSVKLKAQAWTDCFVTEAAIDSGDTYTAPADLGQGPSTGYRQLDADVKTLRAKVEAVAPGTIVYYARVVADCQAAGLGDAVTSADES